MQPRYRFTFDPTRLAAHPHAESRFVADLVRHQQGQGLIDKEFVGLLDVSLTLWRRTRSGKLPLSFKLLMAGSPHVSHPVFEAARASLVDRAASDKTGRPRKDAA